VADHNAGPSRACRGAPLANLGSLTSAADPPRLRVRAGISPTAHRGCVCPGSGSRKRGCRARYRGRFVLRGGAQPPGVLTAPVLGGSVFPASGSCPRAGPSLRLAMAVYGRHARFARREGRSLGRVRCAFRHQEFPRQSVRSADERLLCLGVDALSLARRVAVRRVEHDAFWGDFELADVGVVAACTGLEHGHGTP